MIMHVMYIDGHVGVRKSHLEHQWRLSKRSPGRQQDFLLYNKSIDQQDNQHNDTCMHVGRFFGYNGS